MYSLTSPKRAGNCFAPVSNVNCMGTERKTYCFLFGEIARGSQNDDYCVVLQFDGPSGAICD